jgi:hydrogenase expression/formation protein HypE
VVAVVEAAQAHDALARWQELPQGCDAAIIGNLCEGQAHAVLETELGGHRMLEELEDDPLPRIC